MPICASDRDGVAATGAARVGRSTAPSTSRRMIRPWGPDPEILVRSSPFCPAIRRASGEAKMRAAVDAGAATMRAGAAGTGAGGVGTTTDTTGAGAAPSPDSRAMGRLTLTPSVPSAIRMASTTPSSTASTSMVALSVSISAITSPDLTVSPGLTCHLASVPSSMVGDRAGIRISMGMFRRSERGSRQKGAPGPGRGLPSWRRQIR